MKPSKMRPTTCPKKNGNREAGQMTIEMILLMTILMSGTLFVFNEMKSRQLVAGFVAGPWKPLKSMIEDGEWAANSKEQHPNLIKRHGSYYGDDAF